MKTDDLIKALAADAGTVKPPISATVWLALVAGAVLAAGVFFGMLSMRSDFLHAITSDPRFMFKFAFTLALAIPALLLVRQLARPDGDARALAWMLGIPIALLAAAVGLEMLAVPSDFWAHSALGTMPGACMKYIPILSLAPLAAMLYALKQGATVHPVAAGAAAGLLSGAIGATLYASFCVDDSPMFVAVWYVAGVAIVVALGAAIGAKLLKW